MADIFQCCNGDPDLKRQSDISKQIDEQLKREKIQFRRTVKILLLGAGESGKSTFLKQMRIIHGDDFDQRQVKEFRDTIYSNIIKGMRVLIDARDKLNLPWGDESNVKHAQFVFNYDNSQLDETVFQSYVESLESLWKDTGILAAFDRRREFQLVGIKWEWVMCHVHCNKFLNTGNACIFPVTNLLVRRVFHSSRNCDPGLG